MADRLDKAIDFHRQQNNVDVRIGYTGDGTGSGDPRVRDNSGRMYVRFQLAGRYTLAVPFPVDTNANVPVADNIPVEVGYIGGEETILRVYRRGYLQSGSNPANTNPSDPNVIVTNTADITQFQCKRSLDSSKPLYVVVLQGYIEISGVAHVFLSDEIDLSSFVPATGERCIACVYLKDDLTLEAFASTPKLITDAITEEDIDECRQQAAATSMSIWGWFLDGDITTLDEDPSKNIDLRPFMAPPSTGGGGGGAPTTAKYITQTPDAGLSAEQALSALATGLLLNTTGTGVLSIATTTGSGDVVLATSPTIVTPTIASFANATHDHTNAAGGGQITDAALSAAVSTGKGGTGQNWSASSGIPKLSAGTASLVTAPSGAIVGDTDAQTLTNKTLTSPVISGGTIDNTPIGTTTRALGYFSALREYIGGFAAIFTHANSADRTYTLPNFSATLATLAGTETFTNKTLTSPTINTPTVSGGSIDNTPIGTTTRALGYFSALREYIGGFAAIFTHANTADRTYTLPDFNGTLSTLAGSEILTNKTLTTPTIGSFTNAAHDHTNAAGGGTIPGTAIGSGTVAAARLGTMTGSNGVSAGASGAAPQPAAADNVKFLRGDATWVTIAPTNATYITQTANSDLSAEQALSSLATGLVKVTTGTGVLSTGTPSVDYAVPHDVPDLAYKEQVELATAAALPACTYANGTSGVGATLTDNSTGVLTVDGTNVTLGMRILVKDQATTANNGIYVCTVAGAVGVAFVLTRSIDADTSNRIYRCMVGVRNGTTNASKMYVMTASSYPTIGTNAITFTSVGQFSLNNIFASSIGSPSADRVLPAYYDTNFNSKPNLLQTFLAQAKAAMWMPAGNSAGVPGVFGCLAMTAVGTATARNIATTNILTRMRRLAYLSAAGAGSLCGHYQPSAQYTTGDGAGVGGFMLVYRFATSDAAAVTGARAFIGVSSATGVPTNVNPAGLTNCIGVAQISTDNTQWYMVYGGSAAQTAVALGTTLGAPTLTNTVFELAITCQPNQNGYFALTVTNLGSGVSVTQLVIPGTPGTQTPLSTTLLAPRAWRTNNATALAVAIDICSMYLENSG